MTVMCPKMPRAPEHSDDRLPRGKVVNVACPKCGGPIAIDTTGPRRLGRRGPKRPRREVPGGASLVRRAQPTPALVWP